MDWKLIQEEMRGIGGSRLFEGVEHTIFHKKKIAAYAPYTEYDRRTFFHPCSFLDGDLTNFGDGKFPAFQGFVIDTMNAAIDGADPELIEFSLHMGCKVYEVVPAHILPMKINLVTRILPPLVNLWIESKTTGYFENVTITFYISGLLLRPLS